MMVVFGGKLVVITRCPRSSRVGLLGLSPLGPLGLLGLRFSRVGPLGLSPLCPLSLLGLKFSRGWVFIPRHLRYRILAMDLCVGNTILVIYHVVKHYKCRR